MFRTLTASDRSSLIRLASTLPAGSPERKAILAGLAGLAQTKQASVNLVSPSSWKFSDAGDGMLDHAGYTGESHYWSGTVNGAPITIDIEIDLRGIGEVHVYWSGMHWVSMVGLRNINTLRQWAQIVYDRIESGVVPSHIQYRGKDVFKNVPRKNVPR
jgi:hypothetical protein